MSKGQVLHFSSEKLTKFVSEQYWKTL